MKKVLLLSGLLFLTGCSLKESDLDKTLKPLIEKEEFVFDHKKESYLGTVLDVKSDGVYVAEWFDEDNNLQNGINKVFQEEEQILVNTSKDDIGVSSFVELNGKIYFSGFTLNAIAPADKEDTGSGNYGIYEVTDGNYTKIFGDEETLINPPSLFVLDNQLFATIQSVDKQEVVKSFIYNFNTKEEVFSVSSDELSVDSDFVFNEALNGLSGDQLIFSVTRQKGDDIKSSIYSFDGHEIKEDTYNDIYISNIIMIQDRAMFLYKREADDFNFIGYLDHEENLVLTEVMSQHLTKVLDINEGSIIFGKVGEESEEELYYFVKIDGMDISFESTTVMGTDYLKYPASKGFITIDNSREDRTIVKRFKIKE